MTTQDLLGEIMLKAITRALKAAFTDYKEAFKGMGRFAKEHPVAALRNYSIIGGMGYLTMSNITKQEYSGIVVQNKIKMLEVPESCRNSIANDYIQNLERARQLDQLQQIDMLLFSVFYVSEDPERVKTYKAQYWTLHDWAKRFPDRIVEVSIAGRTPMMDAAMIDFDVPE